MPKRVYKEGIYESSKIIRKEIDKLPPLLGVTEVGKHIGGWDRRKVHTYWKRGIIPEPAAFIGSRPVWTLKQIDEWKATKYVKELD